MFFYCSDRVDFTGTRIVLREKVTTVFRRMCGDQDHLRNRSRWIRFACSPAWHGNCHRVDVIADFWRDIDNLDRDGVSVPRRCSAKHNA